MVERRKLQRHRDPVYQPFTLPLRGDWEQTASAMISNAYVRYSMVP
jgi:hypothetical protein